VVCNRDVILTNITLQQLLLTDTHKRKKYWIYFLKTSPWNTKIRIHRA